VQLKKRIRAICRLSKDESGEASNGGEEGRAGEGSSAGGNNGLAGVAGVRAVASRRSDGRRRDRLGGVLRLAGARDSHGLGLNSGDGGDVLLGDVGGGVAGALRLLRLAGVTRVLGLAGLAGVAGGGTVASVGRAGRVRVGSLANGADGGRDGDGLGDHDGGVSRAVVDLRRAVNDGVHRGGVDGGGGHGLVTAGLGGAVDGSGGDNSSGGGAGGGLAVVGGGDGREGDDGSRSGTHFDWYVKLLGKRTKCLCVWLVG
jgi:hypothetical protein